MAWSSRAPLLLLIGLFGIVSAAPFTELAVGNETSPISCETMELDVKLAPGPRLQKALEGPTVLLAPAANFALIAFLLQEGLSSLSGNEGNFTCHLAMDALRCGADSTEALVAPSRPHGLLDRMNDVSVMAWDDVSSSAPIEASWIVVMERDVVDELMGETRLDDEEMEVYKNVTDIVSWLTKDGWHSAERATVIDRNNEIDD